MSTYFAHCEKCDHLVTKSSLEAVQVCRQTFSSPAEYEDWCDVCRRDPERDEQYERQAARDRLDDFSRTGGKDWT